MRKIESVTAYRRDMKRLNRQNKNMNEMRLVIDLLRNEITLPPHYQDHPLKGKWKGCRELHIAPDWLLIYHIANDTIYLDRTGSHAELLKQ